MAAADDDRIDEDTRAAWHAARVDVETDAGIVTPIELARARGATVHVITAWNPDVRPVSDEENLRADEELVGQLDARGATRFRAIGSDPTSSYEEHGWAVIGLDRAEACSLGSAFSQVAIYEATDEGLAIVYCDSGRVEPVDRTD